MDELSESAINVGEMLIFVYEDSFKDVDIILPERSHRSTVFSYYIVPKYQNNCTQQSRGNSMILGEIVSHIPIMSILGTFFSETNKHRTMKLYIATFPLSMHKLCFFCKHW